MYKRYKEEKQREKPLVITTSAKVFENSISFESLSEKIFNDDNVYLLFIWNRLGINSRNNGSFRHIF